MAEEYPEKYEKVVEVLYDDLMAWVIRTLRDEGSIPKDADVDFAFVPHDGKLAYRVAYRDSSGWKPVVVESKCLTSHYCCAHNAPGVWRDLDPGFVVEQVAFDPQAVPGKWAIRYVMTRPFVPVPDDRAGLAGLRPFDQLEHCLLLSYGSDGLPRNWGGYRILEIDTRGQIQKCRPRDWHYAFWGPWVLCAKPVMICLDYWDVLTFFWEHPLVAIDDGIGAVKPPERVFDPTVVYDQPIVDTIAVETKEDRCFVIRDWERTLRAYRETGIRTRYEGFEALNEVDTSSEIFKMYMIPGIREGGTS